MRYKVKTFRLFVLNLSQLFHTKPKKTLGKKYSVSIVLMMFRRRLIDTIRENRIMSYGCTSKQASEIVDLAIESLMTRRTFVNNINHHAMVSRR